ncbi:MAG: HD-GYP domain-containing protein [Firmicutes bacterium]|nr:HD-GYP domain-containing protein [Bacillota bacterium]
MKPVQVSALVPGMILAKDVYQNNGILLLNEDTVLTAELITKLKFWGFSEVEIQETPISLKDQEEAAIAPQISAAHDRVVDITENMMSSGNAKDIDLNLLRGMVGDLDSQIELNTNVLLNLSHIKTHDNYLFAHVTNVAILAMIIGKELKLSEPELKDLGLSALLHDFGMTRINRDMYDKNKPLSPEEWLEIKRHPDYSLELLKESGSFSEAVLRGIHEHHERIDGSGYPRGIKGADIHLFGKIIAVADVYDACISPRKHRRRMTPYDALKNLLSQPNLFDIKILKSFVACMAIYPIGSLVKLNTGEIAKVIGINQGAPFRPEIRIYLDQNGEPVQPPIRINLFDGQYLQTYIQNTLEYEESEKVLEIIEKNQ